jgi:branched-chain amino acid transport system substrate-binding protein
MNLFHKGKSITILLLFILSGCSFGKSAKAVQCLPIRIGVIIAHETQESGMEQKKGYEMALADINQAGGIQGCPIELIYKNEGEETDTEAAQVAVMQLADENVLAILGGTTNDATMRAAAIASYFKVPLLIPSATSDEITQRGNQWVFRLSASNKSDAGTAFEMVRNELGAGAKTVILYEQTSYGQSAAVVTATAAIAQEMDVIGYFSYSTQNGDLTALAEQVTELEPEVVYIISSDQAQASGLLGTLQMQHLSANMVIGHGPGFMDRSFLYDGNQEVYTYLDHLILVANWATDLPWHGMEKYKHDFQVYSQEHDQVSTIPVIDNVETYSALHLMAGALEQLTLTTPNGKKNQDLIGDQLKDYREKLAQALRNLDVNQRDTLFGPVVFDGTGQNMQTTVLVQVLEGSLVTVYPPKYAVQEPDYVSGW